MKSSKKNESSPPESIQPFPVIGVGASAGGLEAFKRLLKAIPGNSGMAYVLVQHLSPSHESILPGILAKTTAIPVHEITDEISLAPNNIYVIPSNKILTAVDGVLKLNPRDKNIMNKSIDIFFASLAEVHREFAVGVVLSGTATDGTTGLKAIKASGGITIVQDPQSADYNGMPQNAIDAGVADFILLPEQIPQQLLQINNASQTNESQLKETEETPVKDEDVFKEILSILRNLKGGDFTHYKQPTLQRRIARRMAISKREKIADYLNLLRSNKTEQNALFQDLLIPVTSFFRDPKTFQTLMETVFPALLKNKPSKPIRIWVAGCSTGEEAYSIAICLHEFLEEN
jgi:two-component system CheB/CheR fusion protein